MRALSLSTCPPPSSLPSLTQLNLLFGRCQVYVVDKTEANPLKVSKHPAWASEITLSSNAVRAMDIVTNSFCAGGNFLGDGRMLNVGGNQGITTGGLTPQGEGSPVENGTISVSTESEIECQRGLLTLPSSAICFSPDLLFLNAGGAPYYDLDGGQA